MKNLNGKQIAVAAGLLIAGIVIGRIFFSPSSSVPHQEQLHESIAEVWTCAMHQQIRKNEPGLCPICGMDLIPVGNVTNQALDINQIQMTEAAMKLADIQTVIVGSSIPEKQLYLPGRIEVDERGIANVTAHFSGRVEKLHADFTGQFINRGQLLATLYSPDLVTAQKELFEAMKFRTSNPTFYQAAVQKLKLWELTDGQIRAIEEKGEPQYNFNVYAHRSGTIISRKISEGEHVMDGQSLFEIADLNRLWVLFDAYESDLPWIRVGDAVSFKAQSIPGRTFQSVVTFIDPVVNNQTRTASVRAEISNDDNLLKPEMFVEGIVNAGLTSSEETLVIPKTAVLWTGKRSVVYVKQPQYEQPTFEFREIALGTDAGEYYVVTNGLTAGEEVAANGVFKIDGAAQLQGKISMMNPQGSRMTGGHQHQEMAAVEHEIEVASQRTFESPIDFRDQLKEIYKAYLLLVEALVNTDLMEARQSASRLLNIINQVDANGLHGEAGDQWRVRLAGEIFRRSPS
jgi:Cu(I)/Ag(I) efflux system membrane fusion protein